MSEKQRAISTKYGKDSNRCLTFPDNSEWGTSDERFCLRPGDEVCQALVVMGMALIPLLALACATPKHTKKPEPEAAKMVRMARGIAIDTTAQDEGQAEYVRYHIAGLSDLDPVCMMDGIVSVVTEWSMEMRKACSEGLLSQPRFSPLLPMGPTIRMRRTERILCGGTVPPKTMEEADILAKHCDGRTGWIDVVVDDL